MTLGLDWSEVSKCKWAVENNKDAAATFKLNFPDATVYVEDAREWFDRLKASFF
jgi:site-specific DNA-cytosine methylase